MKRISRILTGVTAVLALKWVNLESRRENTPFMQLNRKLPRRSSPRAPRSHTTSTATPWGLYQQSFMAHALGKEPKANGL
jgi:hypothetical protein